MEPTHKVETLEQWYKRKFEWLPDNLRNQIGHFNIFGLEPFVGKNAKPVPYARRDYYKIMLIVGHSKVHYADKVVEVKKQALSFSNPQIPYKWEHLDQVREGVFCVFNQDFFRQFGDLGQYEVFQPQGSHIFELTDDQVETIKRIYDRMFEEIGSGYLHKYDLLRNLVYELIHFATKMQTSSQLDKKPINASQRITTLFLELLERQFPIDEPHPIVQLPTASDFARQLNVHVNHLNRAVKKITLKTTSQLIAERILQEAKVLLKHSVWSVSEIGYALGFREVTHFDNFFKQHVGINPSKFRNS